MTGGKPIVTEQQIIANQQSIVGLSAQGIAVTSNTARHLVQYFDDIRAQNQERIPCAKSISRLGWVEGVDSPRTSRT